MSTTAYDLSVETAPVFGGAWTNGSGGGHDYVRGMSYNAEVQFTATGTDLAMQLYVQDNTPFTLTVDGVESTPSFAGSLDTWIIWNVFTGLADTAHTVKIKLATASSGRVFLERGTNAKTIQLTGAAPAIGTPSPFGATRQVYTPATDTTNFRQDGEWSTVTAGNMTYVQNGVAGNIYAGGTIRFSAKTDAIFLWGFSQATQIRLTIDGVQYPPQTLGTVGDLSYGWRTVITGLALSATYHTFELMVDSNAPTTTSGGSQCIIYQVMVQEFTGVNPTPLAAKNQFAVYGDSISSPGYWPTGYGALESWCHGYLMAKNRGLGYVGCGIPATTVSSSYSGATSGQSRTADLTRLGSAVTHCVVHYGINDLHFGVDGATFQTAYQAMMTSLLAGLSACQFYCLGVLPQNPLTFGLSASQIAAWNARIVAAIAALGSSRVMYIDPTNWPLNPPSGAGAWALFVDGGVHPNAGGYGVIAQLIESAIGGAPPVGRPRPRQIGVG